MCYCVRDSNIEIQNIECQYRRLEYHVIRPSMFCKVISLVWFYSTKSVSLFCINLDSSASFNIYVLTISVCGQVREAIGVTLSVVCSNIRLYESFDLDRSHESASKGFGNQFNGRSWVLVLKERASEVVMNIQNTTQSDNLETPALINPENGHLNGDSQADVKWMETVLISELFK